MSTFQARKTEGEREREREGIEISLNAVVSRTQQPDRLPCLAAAAAVAAAELVIKARPVRPIFTLALGIHQIEQRVIYKLERGTRIKRSSGQIEPVGVAGCCS